MGVPRGADGGPEEGRRGSRGVQMGVPRRADGGPEEGSPLPPCGSWFCSSLSSTQEPEFTTEEFQEFPISLKRKPLQDLLRGSEGRGRALCSWRRPCMQGSALGGPSLLPAPLGPGRAGPGSLGAPLQGSRHPGLPVCPEASGRLCEAPCGLAPAPGLAAVHSLCWEIVLLGTLSFTSEKHVQRL